MGRRKLFLVAGTLVTVVSLYFALKGTDFSELGASLRGARFELVPIFLACLGGFYALKALRWKRLLQHKNGGPDMRSLVGPMMIGFAANNVLPFRLGEIIRMLVGAKRTSLPQVTVLTSIVIERIFDVIALLILTSAVAWTDLGANMTHPIIPYVSMTAFVVAAGLLLVAFGTKPLVRLLDSIERQNPTRVLRWLRSKAHTVDAGMQSIRNPVQLLLIILNSIAQWLLLAFAILVACTAVNVTITLAVAIYLMLVMTIAISIPSTPGFIGIIEYSFVLTLGTFGTDAGHALAAAIFYHVVTWVSVTATGTVFLHRYSLGWAQLGKSPAPGKGTMIKDT